MFQYLLILWAYNGQQETFICVYPWTLMLHCKYTQQSSYDHLKLWQCSETVSSIPLWYSSLPPNAPRHPSHSFWISLVLLRPFLSPPSLAGDQSIARTLLFSSVFAPPQIFPLLFLPQRHEKCVFDMAWRRTDQRQAIYETCLGMLLNPLEGMISNFFLKIAKNVRTKYWWNKIQNA